MKIQLLLFGVARDIFNTTSIDMAIKKEITVIEFKQLLITKFPKMSNLRSFAIAINESYAQDKQIIQNNDIIAIIPPVSGG